MPVNQTFLFTFPAGVNTSFANKSENISLENNWTFPAAEHLSESWWNVFDERYFRHSWEWTITLIIAYMLILVVGVIGNCMVILVVILRPRMRSVTNIFIMNLAVADLFVIVFCVCPTLLANLFKPWILGSFMCKCVAYVQGVSVCASAYSLGVISLDRCQAIHGAFQRFRGLSKTQAMRIICLIWMIALAITIPWAVIFEVIVSDEDGFTYCVETWKNEYHGKIYFLVVNLLFCYGLPFVIISISNAFIWCHVMNRKVPQNSASEGPIRKMHKKARQGVVKMLGVVTLTFLLSWMPLYIIVSRYQFAENISEWESNLLDILYPLAQWLGSSNSGVNPVLYAFLNKKFREMFKSILPKWIPCVRKAHELRRMGMLGYGVTISNGNFVGSFRTRSCTTASTRRSSCRRSTNFGNSHNHRSSGGRNFHRQKNMLVITYEDTSRLVNTKLPTNAELTAMDPSFMCSVEKATKAQLSKANNIVNV